MAFFILLSMIFLQLHAADDNSLVVMYQCLEEAEKKSDFSGEDSFVYEPFENWQERYPGLYLDDIRRFMQKENALQEVGYFTQLAASKRLSDTEKLKKPLVWTNYFMQLESKEQKEKDEALKQLLWVTNHFSYPVGRLLIAALVHAGANVDVYKYNDHILVRTTLLKDDISLLKMALDCGADPNNLIDGNSVLSSCESAESARLMIHHGADVGSAHWRELDMVGKLCCCVSDHTERSCELLSLYLQHVLPNENNRMGRVWMKLLAKNTYGYLEYSEKTVQFLTTLLEHGCECDGGTKGAICERFAKENPGLEAKVKFIFANHEEPGKNIKGADE